MQSILYASTWVACQPLTQIAIAYCPERVTLSSTNDDKNVTGGRMAKGRYISYLRVSGKRQGRSGLGLEAQRSAVESYLNGGTWELAKEFVEVESGKRSDRPQLDQALRHCRLHNATLIVGKLDRLARNTRFLLKLVEESGRRGVVFCDLPNIPEGPTGKFMITQMAAVAEFEGAAISARTKAALDAAKARGTVLGGRRVSKDKWAEIASKGRKAGMKERKAQSSAWAADVLPIIEDIRELGAKTLREIASALNERGIETRRGGQWSAVQVKRVVDL
jgi:DNA invertase Pin-like site-specific DNA recombinase